MIECNECGGTGINADLDRCEVCGGRGRVHVDPDEGYEDDREPPEREIGEIDEDWVGNAR